MKNEDVRKILKYRPPLLLSLLIIVGFFALFLYISKYRISYAIVEQTQELNDKIDIKSTVVGISSDNDIKVNRINNDTNQVFETSINNNYGSEYIKDKKIEDLGLMYIISNSYPNKDITDSKGNSLDTDFQTWISQASILLYLNDMKISNLDNNQVNMIKSSKKLFINDKVLTSKKTIYEDYIKDVVDNAKKSVDTQKNVVPLLENDNIYMTKNNKYYQSSLITVSNNYSDIFKGYTIDLSKAPRGTIVVDEDGRRIKSGKRLKFSDKFYVRVPKNKIVRGKSEIVIGINGIYSDIEGYYYKSEGYDNIIAFRKFDNSIEKDLYIKF